MPRRLGAYAPLSATYSSDDAIIAAGEKAELLYVRGLAFCASTPENNGYVTEAQLIRFVGAGMRDATARAKTLVRVGLWEQEEGGYVVRAWLKWNKSADQLGRERRKDRERKAAAKDSDQLDLLSDSDDDSDWNPDGSQTEAEPESGDDSDRSPDGFQPRADARETGAPACASGDHSTTQHNNPPTPPGGKPGSRRAAYDYDRHPDFQRFWNVYPEKSGKGAALKAWLNAVKRGRDPEAIITAAERYRSDPRRNPEKTKHPQGWLNDERFLDQATVRSAASGGWLEN